MTNTEKVIHPPQFLAEVREIATARAAELGYDYVYERVTADPDVDQSCLYVHDDELEGVTPGCVIGAWLHLKHDVSLDSLRCYEGDSGSNVVPLFVKVTLDTQQLADTLQSLQDDGVAWVHAVEVIEARYARMVDADALV